MGERRILFAGNFHWNAGSSHVIAAYAEAAAAVGCEVGVSTQLARLDNQIGRHLPLVDDVGWATHLVLVFEGRQFLSDRQKELCERVPRDRRVAIDPDGHWGPTVVVGDDSTNPNGTAGSWHRLYRELSDIVLQPRIRGRLPDGAEFFTYFGMPAVYRRATDAPVPEALPFELQYIGSNWWRWRAMTDLIHAARAAEPPLRRMRVCGRWWDGLRCSGHEHATGSEPGWLRAAGVEVCPSVPFGRVVAEMARATLSPILVRPALAAQGLLTPRMFETLASGSIPVLADELDYLGPVYGDHAQLFRPGIDGSAALAAMLADHHSLRVALAQVQDEVHARFNYERVLAELLLFVH
ncbi:MAG: glycosyltransferase family protein [Pseudonocardiaceae bacterium]